MQNQPYGGAAGQPAYGAAPAGSQGAAPGYPQPGAAPGYPPAGASQGGFPQPGASQGYPPAGAYPSGSPAGYPQPAGAVPQPAGAVPQPAGAFPQPAGTYAPPAGAAPPGGQPPSGSEYRESVNWDVEPSAPPAEKMDMIPGYDSSFMGGELAPPSYDDAMRGSAPPDRSMNTNMPSLSEEEAKEALQQEVAQHCCYGSSAARDLVISGMDNTMAFHYKLETFTEMRTTVWAVEPYKGQPIDGPQNGRAPTPWEVPILASQTFKDSSTAVEVPHTASVKPCHTCIGLGRVRCHHCLGMGQKRCTWCHGNGRRTVHRDGQSHHETCDHCHGNGRSRCTFCHGHGFETCRTCTGRGQLKCFIRLTVTWKNHDDDHIVERTELPDNLIKKAHGILAFQEEAPLVWAINHFPEQVINQASNNLVSTHRTKWPNERILLQRHNVRIVPVTQVHFQWKKKQSSYFVYGTQHLVHAPTYPQKCCCGCTIL